MKNLMRVFFALSMFFAMGCDDDDDNDQDNIMNFSAGLSGTGENPPNASTASGTATAIYNETTNRLSISVPYTGMTATAAHIHKRPGRYRRIWPLYPRRIWRRRS